MNRRDFIKNTAAVIATAALLPAVIKLASKVTVDIETVSSVTIGNVSLNAGFRNGDIIAIQMGTTGETIIARVVHAEKGELETISESEIPYKISGYV